MRNRSSLGALRRRRILLGAGTITDFTVSASESTVTLSSSSFVEGGSTTLIVTARNAEGQRLSGKAITSVTVDPSTGVSVTGSGDTNGAGVATRTITATVVDTGYTVTVVCDGVSLDQVPTFDVTSAPSGDAMFVPNMWNDLFVPGFWVGV